jgi:hypothetical protein
MNPKENEAYEAFKYLHSASVPDEAAIDAMSEEQVDQFLADTGCDLNKLRERLAERKKRFSGRYALMLARRERLTRKEREGFEPIVPDTKEGIITAFEHCFGDAMPIAARGYKTADYEELRRLYLDLFGGKGARPDGK